LQAEEKAGAQSAQLAALPLIFLIYQKMRKTSFYYEKKKERRVFSIFTRIRFFL